MVKKIFSALIVTSLLLIFPCVVSAADGSISISCEDTITRGGSLMCSVVGSSSDVVGGASFQITVDDNLEITSEAADQTQQCVTDESHNYSCTSLNTTDKTATFATFTVKAKEDAGDTGTITLVKNSQDTDVGSVYMTVGVDSPQNVTLDDVTKTLTIVSGDGSTSEETTGTSNPKTMDMNIVIVVALIAVGAGVVFVGRKKLDKISK